MAKLPQSLTCETAKAWSLLQSGRPLSLGSPLREEDRLQLHSLLRARWRGRKPS